MLSWFAASGVELRHPLFLLAVLLAPLVFALARKLPAWVTYSSLTIADTAPRGLRVRLTTLPALLLGGATVSLAIALAGPRTGDATTKVKREGIAIMLAVDRSGSMEARDFVKGDYNVSRLDAVKQVLKQFVLGGESLTGRPNDLMGLVVFGTYADGLAPLTLDHANLASIIEDVTVALERSESATAIGEGLGLAIERLSGAKAESKVIVLLTDGVNNAGEIDPSHAAELAAVHGIRVYTVGAGTTGVAPMPVRTAGGQTVLRAVQVEIDERALEDIAKRTGGKYFNARDAAGLKQIYAEIDRLERTEITEIRYLQYQDHYPYFVIAALALIALASIASGTFLRTLP